MADAGFEYVPVNVQTVEAAQARVRQDPGLTRREYKERYGLAVTTRFDDPVRDIGLGPENLRIIASLPEASRVAYNRTLFGRNTHANFVFALDEEDFSETGGCTRKAVAKVFTPDQVKGTFVNPKDVLVDSDKRFVAARQLWSKCMRAAGYDYVEDQDEIIEDFEERLDKTARRCRAAEPNGRPRQGVEGVAAGGDRRLACRSRLSDQVHRQGRGTGGDRGIRISTRSHMSCEHLVLRAWLGGHQIDDARFLVTRTERLISRSVRVPAQSLPCRPGASASIR
jgi:hypothetical protein